MLRVHARTLLVVDLNDVVATISGVHCLLKQNLSKTSTMPSKLFSFGFCALAKSQIDSTQMPKSCFDWCHLNQTALAIRQ